MMLMAATHGNLSNLRCDERFLGGMPYGRRVIFHLSGGHFSHSSLLIHDNIKIFFVKNSMPALNTPSNRTLATFTHIQTHRHTHHLQTRIVYPLWPDLIILLPGHKALADTLIDHKDDLGGDLSAQKGGVVETDIFPFGEILGWFGESDAGWCLTVRGMDVVLWMLYGGSIASRGGGMVVRM